MEILFHFLVAKLLPCNFWCWFRWGADLHQERQLSKWFMSWRYFAKCKFFTASHCINAIKERSNVCGHFLCCFNVRNSANHKARTAFWLPCWSHNWELIAFQLFYNATLINNLTTRKFICFFIYSGFHQTQSFQWLHLQLVEVRN